MAGVTCIYCHAENEPGDQLCRACFRKLPTEPSAPPRPAPDTADTEPRSSAASAGHLPTGKLPVEAPAHCPHCGAEVPDPRNQVCVECHCPLARPRPLRLSFPHGEIAVEAAVPVRLGRDPTRSPVWQVFADHDNVSRLHATVGVDDEGPWVRDERSLNGTYVNGVPVPPGTRIILTDGDTLRLAADVSATVRLRTATK